MCTDAEDDPAIENITIAVCNGIAGTLAIAIALD